MYVRMFVFACVPCSGQTQFVHLYKELKSGAFYLCLWCGTLRVETVPKIYLFISNSDADKHLVMIVYTEYHYLKHDPGDDYFSFTGALGTT